mmetsp:Transcript_21098/g.50065  ORF Transcript_21098/g.50065 Transcript_21098/m.50065 type:complete len:313 (+) Transcript_21098:327-1265(+)
MLRRLRSSGRRRRRRPTRSGCSIRPGSITRRGRRRFPPRKAALRGAVRLRVGGRSPRRKPVFSGSRLPARNLGEAHRAAQRPRCLPGGTNGGRDRGRFSRDERSPPGVAAERPGEPAGDPRGRAEGCAPRGPDPRRLLRHPVGPVREGRQAGGPRAPRRNRRRRSQDLRDGTLQGRVPRGPLRPADARGRGHRTARAGLHLRCRAGGERRLRVLLRRYRQPDHLREPPRHRSLLATGRDHHGRHRTEHRRSGGDDGDARWHPRTSRRAEAGFATEAEILELRSDRQAYLHRFVGRPSPSRAAGSGHPPDQEP